MIKTLKISFSLRNTYRVNSILYSLKQIPLVKRLLPAALYQVRGLKIFANILSLLWEVLAVFLGKGLYLLIMVAPATYGLDRRTVFLHILVLLSILGSFSNTYMFNGGKDKYYALISLRMNAREYTLVNYGYAILKVIAGFLPFAVLFGMAARIPLWQCLMIPFFVAGLKLTVAAWRLEEYQRKGTAYNENRLQKVGWLLIVLLLAAAYGLPALGILIPGTASVLFMAASIVSGLVSVRTILRFPSYREMYQEILKHNENQLDQAAKIQREQGNRLITKDVAGIESSKKGFEYLNELFIRRHQKILWKSVRRQAAVCAGIAAVLLAAFWRMPDLKEKINELIMTYLPYFVFIMYAINRGTGFIRALFVNCDHSLLTYSFYKQPGAILRLFQIRLREIIKINLLPAAVIGAGLAVLLYASGGTDNPLNYGVLLVSILCMSVFFSVHYLTIYYLLQPYNAGTEIKSGTYQLVLTVTYAVCFLFMRLQMPTLLFGGMTILFCVLYCIAACVLVYRFAPRTFRIRA